MTSMSLSTKRTISIAFVVAAVARAAAVALTSAPFAIEKVKAAPPSRPAGFASAFLAARHAQATADGRAAIGFFDEALGYDPQNIDLLSNAYFLAVQVGNFENALPLAKKAYDIQPNSGMGAVILAADHFKRQEYDRAWFYLSKIPAQSMNGFAMPLLRAWGQAPSQPADKTIAELAGLKNFQDANDLVAVTTALLDEFYGDNDGALAQYDALAKRIEEQRLSVVRLVAEGYQRLGKTQQMKDALTRFIAARGDIPMIEAYRDNAAALTPRKVTPQLGMADALVRRRGTVADERRQRFSRPGRDGLCPDRALPESGPQHRPPLHRHDAGRPRPPRRIHRHADDGEEGVRRLHRSADADRRQPVAHRQDRRSPDDPARHRQGPAELGRRLYRHRRPAAQRQEVHRSGRRLRQRHQTRSRRQEPELGAVLCPRHRPRTVQAVGPGGKGFPQGAGDQAGRGQRAQLPGPIPTSTAASSCPKPAN